MWRAFLAFWFVVSTVPPAHSLDRVRVHAPARTFVMLPFWLGVERKLYEAQGLQIEPIVMASPIAVAALSKGEIDFLTTADSAANAIVRGFKFKIVFLYGSHNLFSLMVTPDIKKPEDLKGKKIGVTSFGGASHFTAQKAIAYLGLDPARDVTILQVGGGSARMVAMESKAISGAPFTPPETEIMKERVGAWPIVSNDVEILSAEPSTSGLLTSESILQSKPAIARKMLQATANSVRFINDEKNEEELVRSIQSGWKISRPIALASLRAVRKSYDASGIPPEKMQRALIQLQRDRYKIQREIRLDELFDFGLARSLFP